MDRDDASSLNNTNPTSITTSTPNTDDESLTTTSTESDNFEAWTLIMNKKKAKEAAAAAAERAAQSDESIEILDTEHVEDLPTEIIRAHAREEHKSESKPDHADNSGMDEHSDGISIISDCDSCGRITPDSLVRHESNNEPGPRLIASPYLSQLPRMQPSELNADKTTKRLRSSSPICVHRNELDNSSDSSCCSDCVRRLLDEERRANGDDKTVEQQRPIQYLALDFSQGFSSMNIFYISLHFLVVLFLTSLYLYIKPMERAPLWEEHSDHIEEIIMQQNLMIGEIDLLNKQVKYLMQQFDAKRDHDRGRGRGYDRGDGGDGGVGAGGDDELAYRGHRQYKEHNKKIKAWAGNGERMDSVDITKDQLKQAYKCDDGSFVEVAGMCVERATDEAAAHLYVELAGGINDALQQNAAYKAFEQVAEQLHAFAGGKANEEQDQEKQNNDDGVVENVPEYERKRGGDEPNWNVERQRQSKYEHKHAHKQHNGKHDHDDDDGDDDDDDSHEHKHSREYNSKERYNKHNNWKQQQYQKSSHSGERQHQQNNNKNHHNNNNYNKHNNNNNNHHEHNGNGGDWHEKRMQYRENARREHEHEKEPTKQKKNWYIKRGDSREQMRHAD